MTQGVIEARAWLVSLACDKAKDHGYPHELWRLTVANRAALSFDTRAELIRDILCRLAAGSVTADSLRPSRSPCPVQGYRPPQNLSRSIVSSRRDVLT